MRFFLNAAAIGLVLIPLSLSAQESVEMSPVVVRDDTENPSTTVIGEEEMDLRQATDLEDVLRNDSEVTVGGGSRSAQKVYVRGIEDTQLNVTIDGARQTGKLFHHQGRLIIDPELLKRVEVEAGTGDALAGPGALGGALRFETKDVEELLIPGRSIGALTKLNYHTNNDEKGISLALFGRPTDQLGLMAYINMTENIDYRAGGGGRVPYTGGKPKGALVKGTWRPTSNQKLSYSSTLRSDNAQRFLRANLGARDTVNQTLESMTHTLGYDLIGPSPLLNLRAEVYNTESTLKNNDGSGDREGDIHSIGALVQNEFRLNPFKLTLGADAHQNIARSAGSSGRNREMGDIYGLFAQGQYDITSSWLISAGARFDDYHLKDVAGNEHQDQRLNPNLSTKYWLSENINTFVSWSQAFEGPTPLEAYIMQGAQGVSPSENLKGTVGETAEFGFTGEHSAWNWSAVLYETRLKHPLRAAINRTTRLVERVNTDDIVSQGYTLAIGSRWNRLLGKLSFTHNKTKYGDQAAGYTVSNRASSFGDRLVFELDYQLLEQSLLISWDSLVAFRMTDVPEGQAQPPSYDVHDLSFIWMPTEQLRAGLSCHNVFDRRYIAHGTVYLVGGDESTLYEPGRDFRIWASYMF